MWTSVFVFSGYTPGSRITMSCVKPMRSHLRSSCFPKWLHHFHICQHSINSPAIPSHPLVLNSFFSVTKDVRWKQDLHFGQKKKNIIISVLRNAYFLLYGSTTTVNWIFFSMHYNNLDSERKIQSWIGTYVKKNNSS